jgi:hypothetical protein
MLIAKITKVVTKLMKLMLNCNKCKLNQAIGNTKAKVDTKLKQLVLNCTKEQAK